MKADWKKVKLGDLCEITSSKRFHLSERTKNGVPFYCTKEILQKLRGEEDIDCDYIDEKFYLQIKEKFGVPVTDDLLLTTRGTIGFPYLYKDTDKFYFADGNLSWFRNFSNSINSHFLYYWFLSSLGKAGVDSIAKGTAQKAVPITGLGTLEISLPPLETQQKIASILSAYDDLIENNRKQIKLLEEAAQCLYKEWFVDLRFPGYENVAIVDGVPEGWRIKLLSNVFEYVRGKSYTSKELVENGGTLMVNLKNIRAFGGYNRNAEKRYSGQYKESQKLKTGDLVMGVTDMTQERRLVGHVAIIPDIGETMTFSMDLIKLVPLSVKKNFIYAVMYYGGYSKKISQLANGVNVLHLKPESMMNMEMLIPTDEVMNQYDKIFAIYQKKIEALQNQIQLLQQARDKLLPRLMSGEMEV